MVKFAVAHHVGLLSTCPAIQPGEGSVAETSRFRRGVDTSSHPGRAFLLSFAQPLKPGL